MLHRLVSGYDLYEPLRELVELISAHYVFVEGLGVELGQYIDLVQSGIKAITDGYVDQAVLAEKRYCGLGPVTGQGIKPRAAATPKYHAQYVVDHISKPK